MNDIRDLFPGRMRERTFQLKARRDTGVAWHEPQFVECKQCGRRATRQIWAKSLFVCPNCGNHQRGFLYDHPLRYAQPDSRGAGGLV